jgi:adenosylcobinamide-GDP ribazoletransferase
MRDGARLVAVAFGFLTRLPVPHVEVRDGDLARASALFGLVGLTVAAVGVAVRGLVAVVWGPVVGAVAGVLAITLVTGALHEDGLADAADGLWGGWQPEERLRIMRDSRLGTYGMIVLVAVFALRFALLVPAPPATFAIALVCGHVLGRAAGPVLVRLLPAMDGSSSADVAGPVGVGGGLLTVVLVVGPVVAVAGIVAVPVLLTAAVVMLACAALYRRRLGGITGDTIGATTVLVEVAVIATVVAGG